MSKSIKIDDNVYTAVDKLRGKRDTFSHVIERLLVAAALTTQAAQSLEKQDD